MDLAIRVIAALAVAIVVSQAAATVVVPMSTQDLGRQSSMIVVGRVVDLQSYWNTERTRIETEVVVYVDETFKGTPADVVRIVQPGGIVGNVRVVAEGVAVWSIDEEVLLFLEFHRTDKYHVLGLNQGKYEVSRDEHTGEAWVQLRDESRKFATVRAFVTQSLSQQ